MADAYGKECYYKDGGLNGTDRVETERAKTVLGKGYDVGCDPYGHLEASPNSKGQHGVVVGPNAPGVRSTGFFDNAVRGQSFTRDNNTSPTPTAHGNSVFGNSRDPNNNGLNGAGRAAHEAGSNLSHGSLVGSNLHSGHFEPPAPNVPNCKSGGHGRGGRC